jgi:predicted TIM-barrel fold metal-dependent hydrolase
MLNSTPSPSPERLVHPTRQSMNLKQPSIFCVLLSIVLCSSSDAQGLKNFPVIDVHLHSNDSNSHLPNIKPGKLSKVISPANYSEFRKKFFKELKKNNVVLALVSTPLSQLNIWKDTLNTRFIYSFSVNNPSIYKPYIDSIYRLCQTGNLKGIGEIGPEYVGKSPSDGIYEDLFEIAEKFDLPLAIHTGGGPPEASSSFAPNFRFEYGNPYLLQDLLLRHPTLRVFMMHAGLPNYGREALAMMHMFPKLYVDLGVVCWVGDYEKKALTEFLKDAVIAGFGDRIMLGSDGQYWPESISLSVDFIKKANFLTDIEKKNILYFNAARFFNLSSKQIQIDIRTK